MLPTKRFDCGSNGFEGGVKIENSPVLEAEVYVPTVASVAEDNMKVLRLLAIWTQGRRLQLLSLGRKNLLLLLRSRRMGR